MRLKSITLNRFRNFTRLSLNCHPQLTIIIGKNAVGKTNLLEALYFVIKGQGFREKKEVELIQEGQTKTMVEAEFEHQGETVCQRVDIHESSLKTYAVNKIKKRRHDYMRQTGPAVIFSPSFLSVIDGEMQERRDFFDQHIEQIDFSYHQHRLNYDQALRKRNKILEKTVDKSRLKEELVFWDNYLIQEGRVIGKKRQELVDFFNEHRYLNNKQFQITYLKNEISASTLEASFEKQCLLKKTLVGPQRDIFELFLEGKNIHRFGARSEQRLALLWLTVNAVRLCEKRLLQPPLVLLDDVFSELDAFNKTIILKVIADHQTVITTIDEDFIHAINLPKTVVQL